MIPLNLVECEHEFVAGRLTEMVAKRRIFGHGFSLWMRPNGSSRSRLTSATSPVRMLLGRHVCSWSTSLPAKSYRTCGVVSVAPPTRLLHHKCLWARARREHAGRYLRQIQTDELSQGTALFRIVAIYVTDAALLVSVRMGIMVLFTADWKAKSQRKLMLEWKHTSKLACAHVLSGRLFADQISVQPNFVSV